MKRCWLMLAWGVGGKGKNIKKRRKKRVGENKRWDRKGINLYEYEKKKRKNEKRESQKKNTKQQNRDLNRLSLIIENT